jgi:chorismate lyase
VNIFATFPNTRQRWLKKPIDAQAYRTWLIENGSLTRRLQQRYPDFLVQPIKIQDAKSIADESRLLHLKPTQLALQRDVLLFGANQAVVYAHSVLPKASLRGQWYSLGKLGNRPLGASLFAYPTIKRTALSYKKITANHALYRLATNHLQLKPSYLWARRSIFSLNHAHMRCQSILVTEVFLPSLVHT